MGLFTPIFVDLAANRPNNDILAHSSTGAVFIAFAMFAGGDAIFCPEAADQVSAIRKTTLIGDLRERFFGGDKSMTGGLQLYALPECMDRVASTLFKIRFQLGFSHMKITRKGRRG